MAIMDDFLEFADNLSVAAAAGTTLLGDVVDLQTPQRDVGLGNETYFIITTGTEIITGGTAGTIRFQLVSDAQAAIATDGSATVHWDSGNIVTDDAAANDKRLNAGGIIACVALPSEGAVYERYLGVLVTVGTTTTTAGTVNAFCAADAISRKVYGANTGF
jgi:hypothetical protein